MRTTGVRSAMGSAIARWIVRLNLPEVPRSVERVNPMIRIPIWALLVEVLVVAAVAVVVWILV
jgi:hypothetical protein